ncbi:hypothetical protein SGFS_043890 [Streptomyces graminofaciens]|uniref:Uncharacterized protein n=1 Tax=Streptomyces graminofaciens TaxID=68212 RepID=A0ABM7FAP5_9ACTN|nr:hypothetical protein [Streptomyces graminofaciens]BBC33095.1 hypothetical protein SGFS_043890 [Streptomyces graminofaciens]
MRPDEDPARKRRRRSKAARLRRGLAASPRETAAERPTAPVESPPSHESGRTGVESDSGAAESGLSAMELGRAAAESSLPVAELGLADVEPGLPAKERGSAVAESGLPAPESVPPAVQSVPATDLPVPATDKSVPTTDKSVPVADGSGPAAPTPGPTAEPPPPLPVRKPARGAAPGSGGVGDDGQGSPAGVSPPDFPSLSLLSAEDLLADQPSVEMLRRVRRGLRALPESDRHLSD